LLLNSHVFGSKDDRIDAKTNGRFVWLCCFCVALDVANALHNQAVLKHARSWIRPWGALEAVYCAQEAVFVVAALLYVYSVGARAKLDVFANSCWTALLAACCYHAVGILWMAGSRDTMTITGDALVVVLYGVFALPALVLWPPGMRG
jgi:hypothetical protein